LVSKRVAIAIHDELLAQHGGKPGIRDEGMLDAAMDAPKKAPLFRQAAAYGYGLCQNHPFLDGNKRVALVVMYALLGLNGLELDAPEPETYLQIDGVAAGKVSREELETWIRASCVPMSA
jgi:death-on-curing protein